MEHKLTFTLGDPSRDGHGITSKYHIICNYSSEEIESAYREMCKELGFDFLELFSKYRSDMIISKEHTKALVENGIIDSNRVITEEIISECPFYDEECLNTMEMDGEYEYLEIFFNIIRKKLPDFRWEPATLDFETLWTLHGAGYGLF